MGNFFNRPFRETGNAKSYLLSILAFGLFIFLFLFIFQPFGLSGLRLKTGKVLLLTLGFGTITSAVLIIFRFLVAPVVVGKNWTLGKNIVWDFFVASCIGAANFWYICIVFRIDFSFLYLLYSILSAILVGSIPVTISHILVYNRIYRNALKEADIHEAAITWDESVTITAGYPRNDFRINPEQIVFISSNDNYVTIVSTSNNSINKTTLRGTLKSVEKELKKNSGIIRCHKCYLVNLNFIEKVSGNNQNMKIRLSITGTEIPVARSKAAEVARLTEKTVRPGK